MKENQSDFQLSMQRDGDGKHYWCLNNGEFDRTNIAGDDVHYELRVTRYFRSDEEEKNQYKFYETNYSLRDPVELITEEEFNYRKQAVIDHEGEEAWETCPWRVNGDVRVMKFYEVGTRDKMIRRWEAVCELVSPHNT